jgi:pimeloyl-ACP methyl ester carboxylesterase
MQSEVVRFSVSKSDSNLFIEGDLVIPNNPMGIIVFVHGSGSGKGSYRNQTVSKRLNDNNIATLLFDLLAEEEQESDRQLENIIYKIPGAILNKFNISLLRDRLSMVTDWIMNYESLSNLKIGYFASSTGGAAALIASAKKPVKSITIRSGRTDLVDNNLLGQIISPCLFIVGSKEKSLLDISKQTMKKLRNAEEKELSIIQNASHLFEEEGSMKEVVEVATRWIKRHFS